MEVHELVLPKGYDPSTQKVIGYFAVQLDDQLAYLKTEIGALSTAELEWQLDTGMNTIGVLLAHNAVAEAFWINVAAQGLKPGPEGDKQIKEITGIGGDDDGVPMPADGKHPDTLKGLTLDDYLRMLDSTRAATHKTLQSWTDENLDDSYEIEGHSFSKAWTLYHVLEHFIGHFGQIRLLKRVIKDRGVV